jgi:hypothetical protein
MPNRMQAMTEIRNEFSWSESRDEIFQTCLRQYYCNHCAYWGGGEQNALERIRRAHVARNIKNRFMWVGNKVHQCIKYSQLPDNKTSSARAGSCAWSTKQSLQFQQLDSLIGATQEMVCLCFDYAHRILFKSQLK